MNLYQLEYFKKAAETSSIGRAARELNVTQPAVSKQIRALEDELGEKLFDRIGKRVFLTQAGKLLHSYAKKILLTAVEAKTAVRELSGTCSGELLIGTSDHIGLHRLPSVLKSYIMTYPDVDMKLRCQRSEMILEMVKDNLVDLGIITLPEADEKIILKTVWKDPMSLVYAVGHPLQNKKSLILKDVSGYGMILPEVGTTTRKEIDEKFSQKNLSPLVKMEVAYMETIKVLVKVGLGISILPDRAVEQEVSAGMLCKSKIKDASFSRNLGVVYRKDKFLSRPAREFIRILENAA